jgi:hypothetical protein
MEPLTARMMDTVLRSDPTIGRTERQRILNRLMAKPKKGEDETQPMDKILRRADVATMLGRSPKTVDNLAKKGILKRVVFPGNKKGAGFRYIDVLTLVVGDESKIKSLVEKYYS